MPKQKTLKEQGVTSKEIKKLVELARSTNSPVRMANTKKVK